MSEIINKDEENVSKIEANNPVYRDSEGRLLINTNSFRVMRMLACTLCAFIFLCAIVPFVFKLYIFGIAFVGLGAFCCICLQIMFNNAKKEFIKQNGKLENRSIKEDFKEYLTILTIFCQYVKKNFFKVIINIIKFYLFFVLFIIAIAAIIFSFIQ